MKYIIGLVGENGSGKDTFTLFFKASVAPMTVSRVRFSDILKETLISWDLPLTRANLQNLAIVMDRQFGVGTLTHATEIQIKKKRKDIVIVEGVRWLQDVPMLKKFKNFKLIYITSDPKIRFERLRNRNEKIGENNLTFDQFKAEEKAQTEIQIPQIGATSDYRIENNGTIEEFKEKVEKLARELS